MVSGANERRESSIEDREWGAGEVLTVEGFCE
jgi:hypothetical protein